MKLNWLIIGGGIHGVHIAARLLEEGNVDREDLRIVDPGEQLLDRWRSCTATTGMTHLRSPAVHHLGIEYGSLRRFAGKQKNRMPRHFVPPFDRPSIALFNAHCDELEKNFGLAELHIKDRATKCSIDCDKAVVTLASREQLEVQNVILAIGASEQPHWPDWAPRTHPQVHHVFEPGFDDWPDTPRSVMIVGGGISSGHVALRFLKEGHEVHLVSRHPLREHQFDSDPGWLGVKYASSFCRTDDFDERRSLINSARNRGSVPPDMGRALRRAIARQQLHWHEDEVSEVIEDDEKLEVSLKTGSELAVDGIYLATGFTPGRPGGSMVDELIESASLPCAQCGYPIVDPALRWHPRLYVTGPLAELELGPVSRNIAGARRAGDRIVDSIRSKKCTLSGPQI
ncbi:MAG: hypothetical protein CMJ39_02260 [Phycisphaerae bacterium]|nr:hypothetical protein [Phycisphaerae bacterium]